MIAKKALAVLLVAVLAATGCGGPSEMTPTAYEYSKALYSIANRKAEDRLADVASGIDAAAASGDITPAEQSRLKAIVDKAYAGDWKKASKQSRALMESQVRR